MSGVRKRAAEVSKDAHAHDKIVEEVGPISTDNLRYPVGTVVNDAGDITVDDSKYAGPMTYATFTEDEKRYAMAKAELVRSQVYGQGVITDVDIALYLKKIEILEAQEKDQYVIENVDWNQPNIVDYLNRVVPDFQQRRLDVLNSIAEAQATMTKIEIMGGPQTPEEFEFVRAVSMGKVKVPKESPHILALTAGASAATAKEAFEHGLLYNIFFPDEHRILSGENAFSVRMRSYPALRTAGTARSYNPLTVARAFDPDAADSLGSLRPRLGL